MIKKNDVIYDCLQDEFSRFLYNIRVEFANNNYSHLDTLVHEVHGGKELLSFFERNPQGVYIFGAGALGGAFAKAWGETISIRGIVDNNRQKHGSFIENKYEVVGLDSIIDQDAAFVIIMKKNNLQVRNQLLERGFREDKIFAIEEWYREIGKKQYFDLEIFDTEGEEIFVDCGAYDGATSLMEKKYFPNTKKIYVLEPDEKNVIECKKNLKSIQDCEIELVQKGAWDCLERKSFVINGNGSSSISDSGPDTIIVDSIDHILAGRKVSFIKMDIEGAELKALQGAAETIRKYRPKLAICIYHKPEDIVEIPEYILALNKEYKFYIRHYSQWSSETVLYAI